MFCIVLFCLLLPLYIYNLLFYYFVHVFVNFPGGGGHSTFKWSGCAAVGLKMDPVLNHSAHEKYTLS